MDEDNNLPWWLFLVAGAILVLAFVGCPMPNSLAPLVKPSSLPTMLRLMIGPRYCGQVAFGCSR
jgi:hypothetical protein